MTLNAGKAPKDIQAWYRKAGGWDYPMPGESRTAKTDHFYFVKNVRDFEVRRDSAGNRWCRLYADDMDKPVQITYVTQLAWDAVDFKKLRAAAYTVPVEYSAYLGKTDQCDPANPAVLRKAAALKGATPADSIVNVWNWANGVKYGSNRPVQVSGTSGEGAELTVTAGVGTCRDQAEAETSLFRAMGLAARCVRGWGHSWCEVWLPGGGWHEVQQYVPVERHGWADGFLNEPIDFTSHSPLLNWNLCNNFYISQFIDFFLSGASAEWVEIASTLGPLDEDEIEAKLPADHGDLLEIPDTTSAFYPSDPVLPRDGELGVMGKAKAANADNLTVAVEAIIQADGSLFPQSPPTEMIIWCKGVGAAARPGDVLFATGAASGDRSTMICRAIDVVAKR